MWGECDNYYIIELVVYIENKCWIVKCSLIKKIILKIGLKIDFDRDIKWKKDMILLIFIFLYFIV